MKVGILATFWYGLYTTLKARILASTRVVWPVLHFIPSYLVRLDSIKHLKSSNLIIKALPLYTTQLFYAGNETHATPTGEGER